MAINKEAIIQTSARVARLRDDLSRVKSELKKEESLLDRLLSGEPISTAPQVTYADEVSPTLNQRIVDVISSAPVGVSLDAEEIAEMIGNGVNITSIRSALPRLADQGKVSRAERGKYTFSGFRPLSDFGILLRNGDAE